MPKRGRHTDYRIVASAQGFARRGLSAPQIEKELGGAISLRTIQDIVKEWRTRDTSNPWTIRSEVARPERARVILDTLRAVVLGSRGRIRGFTGREARYVVVVASAAPELAPYEVWEIARAYALREAHDEPADDLDAFLAFEPWASAKSWGNYQTAAGEGWIREAPGMIVMIVIPQSIRGDYLPADGWIRRIQFKTGGANDA
jgi:hypothetical protein